VGVVVAIVVDVADGVADLVERPRGAGLLCGPAGRVVATAVRKDEAVLGGAVKIGSAPTVNPGNGPIERAAPNWMAGPPAPPEPPMISPTGTSPSAPRTATIANPFRTAAILAPHLASTWTIRSSAAEMG
jgi:hypothetical protein